MIFEGFASRFSALRGGSAQMPARFTFQQSAAVAQVEPECFEMTRAGRRMWLGNSASVTGIAPVQAIPTTTAQWVIWNGGSSTGVTYFFEELGVFLTSGTPGLGGTLWAALYSTPTSVGGSATGLTVANMSGSTRNSQAIVKSNVTILTPGAPVWFPLDQSGQNITAAGFSSGYGMTMGNRMLKGALAVQSGQGVALAVMSPTGTTPLWAPFARWIEQETDME